MKTTHLKQKSKKSESGFMTIDFLFGLLLSIAFVMVFLALSYSLAVVEITQYASFSIARTYMASHSSTAAQNKQALKKYAQLQTSLSQIFKSDLFGIGQPKFLTSSGKEYTTGVQIPIQLKMLNMNIPFFGSTSDGTDFNSMITTYLIREPTEKECLDFNDNRAALIGAQSYPMKKYIRVSDNGC